MRQSASRSVSISSTASALSVHSLSDHLGESIAQSPSETLPATPLSNETRPTTALSNETLPVAGLSHKTSCPTNLSEILLPARVKDESLGLTSPRLQPAAVSPEMAKEQTEDLAANVKNDAASVQIEQLIEMFPDKTTIDIERAFHHNRSNLEATVISLLDDEPSASTSIPLNNDTSKDSNRTVRISHSRQRKHAKSARKKSSSNSCEKGDTDAALDKATASEMKSLIVDK